MDVKNAFDDFLVSKNTNSFEKGIKSLVTRWHKCMESNGKYYD